MNLDFLWFWSTLSSQVSWEHNSWTKNLEQWVCKKIIIPQSLSEMGFTHSSWKEERTVRREWEEVMVVKKKEGRRRWIKRERERESLPCRCQEDCWEAPWEVRCNLRRIPHDWDRCNLFHSWWDPPPWLCDPLVVEDPPSCTNTILHDPLHARKRNAPASTTHPFFSPKTHFLSTNTKWKMLLHPPPPPPPPHQHHQIIMF